MSEYFPESKSSSGTVEIELDLSNYATKSNLKHATSKLAKKVDLAKVDLTIRFQSNVDILDIDKSKNVASNFNNSTMLIQINTNIPTTAQDLILDILGIHEYLMKRT